MKYTNANDVLPKELLSAIQTYYQGGYLYIPKETDRKVKRHTDYKVELEKRNGHIYLNISKEEQTGRSGTFIICQNQVSEELLQRKRQVIRKCRES